MRPILVVAYDTSNAYQKDAGAYLYTAASLEEAARFRAAWYDWQLGEAHHWGGYPGYAYVVEATDELPTAAAWMADREAAEEEVA